MNFSGFSEKDFDVFKIDGLAPRMDALIENIRPKLEALGEHFAPTLANLTGNEMFPHVAKHARRTTNPPNDTWVAFANNRRGYKMLPHFQIGMWETHLFIWFAVIYEAPNKQNIGKTFQQHIDKIYQEIPGHFVWSIDHMKPEATEHQQLSKEELAGFFERLQTVKKSELLCGYHIDRDEVVKMGPSQLLSEIDHVFKKLLPLYKMS
ncbi:MULTISPECIES: DUF1054 domain-containing protein [unclassified Bacillus (in: firmicutes)]|uniref:DUF1054 domain-containing protein n=1 Tax=unclassified Bacillus (in: firmicutes) TaxID=185979 RepID=UPI0008F07857|nr:MULTISPECIES: DUF1054 domain-containing protein [unclassified Bacillus (in: firmicutes)]SFA76317.1 Uncharacterized protein YktB, UPF0637 family [Bacillus sp. UNCCL13]SFQ66184.1 Uncharacterized protein YktB, UPF0637 family [Bacillus sp. cl95]